MTTQAVDKDSNKRINYKLFKKLFKALYCFWEQT